MLKQDAHDAAEQEGNGNGPQIGMGDLLCGDALGMENGPQEHQKGEHIEQGQDVVHIVVAGGGHHEGGDAANGQQRTAFQQAGVVQKLVGRQGAKQTEGQQRHPLRRPIDHSNKQQNAHQSGNDPYFHRERPPYLLFLF